MRSIQIEEFVPRYATRYEARDGRLFQNYWECKEYEDELDARALCGIETCSELDDNPPFDGDEHMECHECRWYRPKNEEEIDKLGEVYGENNFSNEDIGKWLCVEFSDGAAWSQTLDNAILYARRMLDYLGFDMIVVSKEANDEHRYI